ncbi:FAD-binding oxidoreductase [Candidatus Saccharibacteria bacterium]|nr:FAD-binding oxidoreductase [Candidatus Saccharibacteria bacterium]MBR3233695.1 FAD-binding oxidoreductase [Candidatus Saccharibacteria bacterium]
MNKIAKYLNQHLIGNVFDSPQILEKYSTDASALKITPQMVVIPENTSDICRTIKFVNQLSEKSVYMPITVRGSGLDKTGADLGDGIVMSMEHMNKILEIDDRSRLVRVQAGVTLGQLNSALALYGLTVPILTNPLDTIGSLIANFATDSAAGKYNGIYYYVDQIEAVISTGETMQTARYSRPHLSRKTGLTSFEGELYREIDQIIEEDNDLIVDLGNRNTIDASGYQMITQVVRDATKSFDLLPLFYASQGTLGIITEVILRCEVFQPEISHFVAAFESVNAAQDFIQDIMPLVPEELNLYDARMFKTAVKHGKDPALFAPKFYKGYFVLAAFDEKPRKNAKKMKKCLKLLPNNAAAVIETEDNSAEFKRLKSAIRSYLNDDVRGERVAIVDDFYIPTEHLSNFLTDLKTMEKTYDQELPVYGSFSTSNYSIRPDVQLNSVEGRQFVLKFLKEFDDLVREHGGSITGGTPEGRLKALVTNSLHTEEELELYQRIKDTFDPKNIFNPGVKLGANETDIVRHIRTSYLSGIVE